MPAFLQIAAHRLANETNCARYQDSGHRSVLAKRAWTCLHLIRPLWQTALITVARMATGIGCSALIFDAPAYCPDERVADSSLMQETQSPVAISDDVTISIVSHGHGAMVASLLADLAEHCGFGIKLIITLNIPEQLPIGASQFSFPVKTITNSVPRGFGANHNAAFKQSTGGYFCILNPDIRIHENLFPALIKELDRPRIGVVAPKIINHAGQVEDSARHFPTLTFLASKLLGLGARLDHTIGHTVISPDWVAGMFMLFRSSVFHALQGFDERYFLYYEDVDLCRRLRKCGYDILLVPSVSAVHDARRESHRNLRHLRWHLASLLRFLVVR